MKISNPYKNEIKALTDTVKNERNKIEIIYSYIKKKISWNESYSFYGNKTKEAIKNKTGDNGQINMILLSALKDVDINAYPIFISRRSQGRIPFAHPSFDKLTTFIVATKTSDSKYYYMDGSAIYGGLNMLPVDLIVDRGRVYNDTVTEKWVDLTKMARNQQIHLINSTINNEGKLSGEISSVYLNQLAYSYKTKYYNAKDSAEFIENYENNSHIKINNITIEGKDTMSNVVKEKISYTKEIDSQAEYLYINPLIFTQIDKNPFTQSERKLPVEFDYPYSFQISSSIDIPKNYIVEETPKSIKISLPDNAGKCLYQIINDNNSIQLNYRFELNRTIFPQSDYGVIQEFFAQVATKNAELIVLKKIK